MEAFGVTEAAVAPAGHTGDALDALAMHDNAACQTTTGLGKGPKNGGLARAAHAWPQGGVARVGMPVEWVPQAGLAHRTKSQQDFLFGPLLRALTADQRRDWARAGRTACWKLWSCGGVLGPPPHGVWGLILIRARKADR